MSGTITNDATLLTQFPDNTSGLVLPVHGRNLVASKVNVAPVRNVQAGNWTLALTDIGGFVEMNSASAQTLTVPTNASVAAPIGTLIWAVQVGASAPTITPASGVTIVVRPGYSTHLSGPGATVLLQKRATNIWVATGDLATYPVAPPQAVNAGFTTLVFSDDFLTNTIAAGVNDAPAPGINWWWGIGAAFFGQTATTVNGSQTAAGLSNGNSGGGANPSPFGGIATIAGPGSANDAIMSIPGGYLKNGFAPATPPGVPNFGCFERGYFEAYLQCNVANIVPPTGSGWPAFWMYSAEGLADYGWGGYGLNSTHNTEVDIVEIFGSQFSDPPGTQGSAVHQPGGGTVVYSCATNAQLVATAGMPAADANWHTYGCLWEQGGLSFFLDNVQVGATAAFGPFPTTSLDIETYNQHLFMILGSGIQTGAQLNVDWVRVWK